MTDEPLGDRAARVRRRFKTGRLDAMGRGFWEHWRPEDSSFLVGMYSTLILLFLEPSLWMDKGPMEAIRVRIPGPVALSLLLVLPFNGWLFDRFLSTKTPEDACLPRWLLGLRFLALSLPLCGLHVLSFWKAFLEVRLPAKPSTARRAIFLDLSKARWRLPSGLQSRVLYRSGFFFVWNAISFLPVFVWALCLVKARELGAWHRPLIFGACIFLHLVACLCMAQYFKREVRKSSVFGWRKALLLIAPFLWLFAIPGMVAGIAIFGFAEPNKTSLSWGIHARRTEVNRDPLWQGIQGRLQQRWEVVPWFSQWRRPTGLTRSEGHGRKDAEIVSFYRLKTLLLVLESMSVTFFLFRIPSLRSLLSTGLRSALWATVALAGTGTMIYIVGLLARLCRVPQVGEHLSRHPYGRYLMLTQTALLAGSYGGVVLSQTSIEQFGMLLCLCMALCTMLTAFYLILPTDVPSKHPDMVLWGLLYMALLALGGLISLEGEGWRSNLLSFLSFSAVLSPLWSLGLFLAFSGWLLRPFSWRHVFERRLPLRLRVALAFVTMTGVIPLGGIAIPFWIYAQHRLWPSSKKLLWNLEGRGTVGP